MLAYILDTQGGIRCELSLVTNKNAVCIQLKIVHSLDEGQSSAAPEPREVSPSAGRWQPETFSEDFQVHINQYIYISTYTNVYAYTGISLLYKQPFCLV